jgi:uncharacterized membrane protein
MQGKATIANHPIHPMLVGFPIGFLGAMLVSDIISIFIHPAFWAHVAMWLLAFGIIGALIAAVAGFTDYLTIPMSAAVKRTATTHLTLNLIAVVLFIVAWIVRHPSPNSTLGYILTYVGLAVLLVSGWYGGHLVYVGQLGVKTAEQTAEERIAESRSTVVR